MTNNSSNNYVTLVVPNGLKNWKISCSWQKCIKSGLNFEACPSVGTTGHCTFPDETSSCLNISVSISSTASTPMWLKVVSAAFLIVCF